MLDQNLLDHINKKDYSGSLTILNGRDDPQSDMVQALVHYLFGEVSKAKNASKTILEKSVLEGIWMTEYTASVLLANIAHEKQKQQELEDLFEQAELLQTINDITELENNDTWLSLYLRLQSNIFMEKSQTKEAIEIITKAAEIVKKTGIMQLIQKIQLQAAQYLSMDNKYNPALSYYHEMIVDHKELPLELLQKIYDGIGDIHLQKGDLNLSLFYLDQLLSIYKTEENSQGQADTLQKMATIYLSKARYDKAVDYLHESQKIHKVRGDLKGTTWSDFQLAITKYRQGYWEEALESFSRCVKIFNQIEDSLLIALTRKFIGDIYRLKGDFNLAKKNFMKSIELLIEIKDNWNLANSYNKLGMVLFHQQEYQTAHQNFQKSLAIYTKIGDRIRSSEPIFNLIRIKLELGALNQAKFFLEMLQEISRRTDDQLVQLKSTLAEALVLKHHGRIIEKTSAQKILQEIVNQPIIDSELTIIAMVNLCDLLLAELHLYQNPEVLVEISELSDKLAEIALDQKSYQLHVEVLILQAKLSLISGDADTSMTHLIKAEEIAEDQQLSKLLENIQIEIEGVSNQLKEWENLTEKHTSIRKKMELANIENYIDSLIS